MVVDAKGTPGQVHVGEVVPVGFYTNTQEQPPDFGSPAVKPYLRLDVKVVGKAVFSRELVQDDVDAGLDGGVLFTPALTHKLLKCCLSVTETAIQLEVARRRGERRVRDRAPLAVRLPVVFYVTALTAAKADRAIKPESIALGVFGGIAALAALLIAGQVVGRELRRGAGDAGTLRALGAGPAMTLADRLVGVLGAIVTGSLLAAAVAVGLSPLAPIGTVRLVDPNPGIAIDWTVLGLGCAGSGCRTVRRGLALAYRQAPHRNGLRQGRAGERGRPRRERPQCRGYRSPRSRGPASRSIPAVAATLCRYGPPSWAPRWR